MLEPKDVDRYVRELRAMIRRAGDEDPEGFAAIVRLLDAARAALPLAAYLNRAQIGYSWADIGTALDVSRQAAAERFGMRPEDEEKFQHPSMVLPENRIGLAQEMVKRTISADVAWQGRSRDAVPAAIKEAVRSVPPPNVADLMSRRASKRPIA